MTFDLRRALLAKEERETARLMDFDFRLRARTLRLLAAMLGREPDAVTRLMARGDDAAVITALEGEMPGRDVRALFARARGEAHRQLVAERGDPTPHRLA